MGGIILVALMAILIVILITPALRARARGKREADRTAHEAVVSRLEDHRRRKQPADTDRSDGSDG